MDRGHRISDPSLRRRLYRRRSLLLRSTIEGIAALILMTPVALLVILIKVLCRTHSSFFSFAKWTVEFFRQALLMEWRFLRDNWNNDQVELNTSAISEYDDWFERNPGDGL